MKDQCTVCVTRQWSMRNMSCWVRLRPPRPSFQFSGALAVQEARRPLVSTPWVFAHPARIFPLGEFGAMISAWSTFLTLRSSTLLLPFVICHRRQRMRADNNVICCACPYSMLGSSSNRGNATRRWRGDCRPQIEVACYNEKIHSRSIAGRSTM